MKFITWLRVKLRTNTWCSLKCEYVELIDCGRRPKIEAAYGVLSCSKQESNISALLHYPLVFGIYEVGSSVIAQAKLKKLTAITQNFSKAVAFLISQQ